MTAHSSLSALLPKSLLASGDERDILVIGGLVLLHSGVHSSSASWLAAMREDISSFKCDRVAIVYNPFDRVQNRSTLSDFLRFLPCSDKRTILAMDIAAREKPRFVDEYVRHGDSWVLQQHDVELHSYLVRRNGIRCVIIPDLPSVSEIMPRQSSHSILMVVPVAFGYNITAAADNKFMLKPAEEESIIRRNALHEFHSLYSALVNAGVNVFLVSDPGFDTPDAVFPNNWFSTHSVGECRDSKSALVLYPMKPATRRNERRPEIIDKIRSIYNYERTIDLTSHESSENPQFLEGTGSMVLDRINRVCYASISERTNLRLAEDWAGQLGYRLVSFFAVDGNNAPIYHTNVLMALGTKFAVICADSIADHMQRRIVLENLAETRDVITISTQQMNCFCGNVLELENKFGRHFVAMSSRAYEAFDENQRSRLLKHVSKLVHVPVPTIESIGGGGVRCMIAEIF